MLAVLAGLTGAAGGFFNPAVDRAAAADRPAPTAARGQRAARDRDVGRRDRGPGDRGRADRGRGAGVGDRRSTPLTFAGQRRCSCVGLRLPAAVPRAATPFLADLREGWGVFRSLTWVWTFVACRRVREPGLGRVERARAGRRGALARRRRGVGDGARRDGRRRAARRLVAVRARPRRPLVLAGVAYGLFVFPLAFLAAGRAARSCSPVGALLGGVAMMLGNSVWESTLQAHVPEESLGRVSAYDWFGSLAFNPVGMAIWGPIAALIGISPALWLAAALVARARRVTLLSVPGDPSAARVVVRPRERRSDPRANMCSCLTSSSTRTPPSPSWTARPRPPSSRRRPWRPGTRRWRSPTTTGCRARWSSRWRPSRWGCGRSTGRRWTCVDGPPCDAAGRGRGRLAQPVPDRHPRARPRPRQARAAAGGPARDARGARGRAWCC